MPDGAPTITRYALPPTLAEIARITSVEVAIAIARKWGGRRLYLPATLPHLYDRTYLRRYDARQFFLERRQFQVAKDYIQNSYFLPHKVTKRLFDQLARAISFTPDSAPVALREWARSHQTDNASDARKTNVKRPGRRNSRRNS
jgi:hypothetical protein